MGQGRARQDWLCCHARAASAVARCGAVAYRVSVASARDVWRVRAAVGARMCVRGVVRGARHARVCMCVNDCMWLCAEGGCGCVAVAARICAMCNDSAPTLSQLFSPQVYRIAGGSYGLLSAVRGEVDFQINICPPQATGTSTRHKRHNTLNTNDKYIQLRRGRFLASYLYIILLSLPNINI